jgi:hypothetical protein
MKIKLLIVLLFTLFSIFFSSSKSYAAGTSSSDLCCPAGYDDGFFSCPFIHDKPCCKWQNFFDYDTVDKVACNVVRNTPCGGSTTTSCQTAIGPVSTTTAGVTKVIFRLFLSIAGTIALFLIISSGYRLMVSRGNPEQIQHAREQFSSAIIGLLFLVFSLVILQFIGVDVLGLPGFAN